MKKEILFLVVALSLASLSFAQKNGRTKFSIGPEIGWATSNPSSDPENKGWGLGVGGSVQAEHFFQEQLSGAVSFGIVSYAGRSSGPNTKNKAYTAIPVEVGGNYYVGNKLHLGAQIGVGFNSLSGESITTFAYTPQIGYKFSRNEKPLDLTFKYDGYAGKGGFGALGLRLSFIL
ncbi:MAG: outer membrane beta-barrel protein [Ginsengibacter sp.]